MVATHNNCDMKTKANLTLMILIVLTMVAIAAILLITRWGVGLSPDSLVYVGAARSFAAGDGLMVPFGGVSGQASPMTHHAPMYSVLLSVSQIVGVDALIGGRFGGIGNPHPLCGCATHGDRGDSCSII